jgi:predicted DNA-binding protein (MmcQ/YjbR family)
VTIVDPSSLPGDYLKELIEWSYQQALGALSKTRRGRLLAQASPPIDR